MINYDELHGASERINKASEKMNSSIDALDNKIKSLNIGLAVWMDFASDEFSNPSLGYDKIGGQWGLCLDCDLLGGPWRFKDAPRMLRLESVPHIARLLNELIVTSDKVTDQLYSCSTQINEIAHKL